MATNDKGIAPFWQSKYTALGILLIALILRLALLSWPPFYTGIEEIHVPSSINYTETGHFDPDNNYSSPFRKILQYPALKIIGDTAIGRRLPNAIFGSLTAFLLVLIGQALFPKSRVGVLSGLFLATDPFHVSFSRTTWEDVPAIFFLTLGFYFLARAKNKKEPDQYLKMLIYAGVAMAVALATRRYISIILIATVAWLIYRELKGPKSIRGPNLPRRIIFFLMVFGLLPIVFYALTFYPWVLRGYSPVEWLSFQQHMVTTELTGINPEVSEYGRYYGNSYRAIDWFTKPVVFGSQMPVSESLTSTLLIINNPLSWFLVWPALAFLLWRIRQKYRSNLALIMGIFALLYLPLVIAQRQILIYSALIVLPTAFLLLSLALDDIENLSNTLLSRIGLALIVVVVASNLILYPLAIAAPLPKSIGAFVPFKDSLFIPDTNQ